MRLAIMMTLDDISDHCHGQRERHYLKNFYGMTGASPDLSYEAIHGARDMATAEMLDEIHTMLRELLKVSTKP
jgi:hypothetical protein